MFRLYDKVVYPGYGVAQINRIFSKIIGGKEASFYELIFLNKDMSVLIPTDNAEAVGLRPLSSPQYVKDVFGSLLSPARKINYTEFTASNWNKRNKEYQVKLKSGDLKDLSEIYRDLHYIAVYKELSFGEKHLLQQIEGLLVEEISLVEELEQEKTIEHLRSLCSGYVQKGPNNEKTPPLL